MATKGFVVLASPQDFSLLDERLWFNAGSGDQNQKPYAATYDPAIGRSVRLHWLIFGVGTDHIDGNGMNNQRANLRAATQKQNGKNRRVVKKANKTSKYQGIYWEKNKRRWAAQISVNGRCVRVGNFVNELEAVAARERAARVAYGEFAPSYNQELLNG